MLLVLTHSHVVPDSACLLKNLGRQPYQGSSATFPILSRDPNLSRKPPETQGNGRKEWGINPEKGALSTTFIHIRLDQKGP